MFQVLFDCSHVYPFAYSKNTLLFLELQRGIDLGRCLFPPLLAEDWRQGLSILPKDWIGQVLGHWSSLWSSPVPLLSLPILEQSLDQRKIKIQGTKSRSRFRKIFPNSNFRFYCTRRNMICLIMILDF